MSLVLKNAAAQDTAYGMFRVDNNRSVFHGPEHTDLKKDQLILTSQEPTGTSDSYGNRRASVRILRTTDAQTPKDVTAKRDIRGEISFSIPVGSVGSDIEEVLARLVALASNPDIVTELAQKGKVQF